MPSDANVIRIPRVPVDLWDEGLARINKARAQEANREWVRELRERLAETVYRPERRVA